MGQNSDTFLKNLLYLSSLAHFNSERVPLILSFYHSALSDKTIFSQIMTVDDIHKFCTNDKRIREDRKSAKEAIVQETVSTLPGSAHGAWNLNYTTERYSHLDDYLFSKFGFHIGSLAIMEKVIIETVYAKAHVLKIPNNVYRFKSKTEYANLCFVSEPDIAFQSKWNACTIASQDELLEAFVDNCSYLDARYRHLSQVKWKVDSEKELAELRLKEGENILRSLSVDLSESKGGKKISHAYLCPLFRLHSQNNEEIHYLVPFPYLLGSTTHFRIEDYIQNTPEISTVEQRSKGEIVEFLAKSIFALFPNRNIIKNFRYKVQERSYESDLILFFDKSIWIAEIKSHPMFKKIPFHTSGLLQTFINKTEEGLEQGIRTLDFLDSERKILFNLGCTKEYEDLIKGVIVVLDGFVPTFLSQNRKFDELLGTSGIYTKMPKATRLYVITILDLYLLNMQTDVRNFENFLIWRTGYRGRFPVVAFDETEYWAFFNDSFLKYPQIKDNFSKMAKKDFFISYISARFNQKDYLEKLVNSHPKP